MFNPHGPSVRSATMLADYCLQTIWMLFSSNQYMSIQTSLSTSSKIMVTKTKAILRWIHLPEAVTRNSSGILMGPDMSLPNLKRCSTNRDATWCDSLAWPLPQLRDWSKCQANHRWDHLRDAGHRMTTLRMPRLPVTVLDHEPFRISFGLIKDIQGYSRIHGG